MKTVLLMGGTSPEREVSLQSGAQVLEALRRLDVDVVVLDPAEDDDWLSRLRQSGAHRVFNILHGGGGENGEVRALLNHAGVACSGSGLLASALTMNKPLTKKVWRNDGVPTPDWRLLESADAAAVAAVVAELPPPYFVKPAAGGSSTNSKVVSTAAELGAAVEQSLRENSGALVEQLIDGDEYTAAILEDEVLPLIRIVSKGRFYDYHAKYVAADTGFLCPCGLPPARERELAAMALRAFHAVHCRHWGRVDFMLDNAGNPYFLEVNTTPGMTSHSLVPMAAAAAGLSFDALIDRLLAGAWLEQSS